MLILGLWRPSQHFRIVFMYLEPFLDRFCGVTIQHALSCLESECCSMGVSLIMGVICQSIKAGMESFPAEHCTERMLCVMYFT